ncbi:PKD domain-containing protein [Pedobacter hiemivivus]|uniref:PKD domain-containing protein n=1 Tax=Pedobacter hiemivivus TaxID=2530454 RepID=A0A4V5PFR0_9SPHI|nr:PKD domain-containing protein [Pedobacter hiemivivus]TKC60326.1 PKD domain-containing protein [Pedobacter hiemivivus]
MVRHLLFFTVALFFFQISEVFSQISIGTVDPGPYGNGSHITVPIIIPQTASCLPRTGNLFNLYLSDENGNFVNERLIGSYAGFYTNFVNGIIPTAAPALVPGSNYKLRVKITGDNSIIEYPTPITIQGVTMPDIAVEPSSASQILGIDTYGFCGSSISDGKNIILTNKSAASVSTQLIVKNEMSNSSQTYNPGPAGFQVTNLANSYYTAQLNGNQTISGVLIKSNKSYLLLNSSSKVSIQSTGDGFGCIDPATGNIAPVAYFVTLNGASGILNNYPGSTYRINWGDGTNPDFYTHCELVEKNGAMTHNFTQTSCGKAPIDLGGGNQVTNAFLISVTTINPFCSSDPNSALSYAKIYVKPIAKINPPLPVACVNRTVTFNNGTIAGYNSNCTRTMLYEWYVDGNLMATTETFSYAFPTNGLHEVKLIAKNDVGICSPSEAIFNICVQNPPKPAFDFTGNSTAHCAPFTIKANDKSVVDAICNTNNTYNWIVKRSGIPVNSSEVTFTNGITEPEFTFLKQGTYEVTLQINTASCGPVTSGPPQTVVIIDSTPKTTLAATAIYCGLGTYTYNNTIAGPTNVQFSGTEVDATDTYTWAVTAADGSTLPGSDYSFTNGTNVTKYPSIKFNQYITYKVSVTHKNSCGTITTDQLVTFKESPSPSIIAPAICYNTNASITGSISNNNYISYTWSSPAGGGSFLNANTLTPTYVPSPADLLAGKATVTLTVNTGLGGVCQFVSKSEEFVIHPNNTGTNATQIICTAAAANLILGSSVAGSTFAWTAANADGFATGFSPSGSGDINQTITNTNATQNAIVVYTITPTANGCAGVPFTFTVTVTPKPIIDPVLDKTICQDNPVGITVTSNIPTQFKWASSASSPSVTGHTNPPALSPTSGSITIPDVLLNPTFLPQTVTYIITPYSPGGCAGAPITVVVTVDPKVTQANAGLDASLCATSPSNTYTLKGNKPDVGTGEWKLISTHTGTLPIITAPTDFETTVTGLLVGETYRFEWGITGTGKCASTSDWMEITVTPLPVISAPVTTKTICEESPVNIVINSDIPTKFTWTSNVTGGITGNTNRTDLITVLNSITITDVLVNTGITQGTVTYTVTPYSATDCPGTPITIEVKVDPKVTNANAGTSTSICNTTTYDLKGNKPIVGTGVWSVVSASIGIPSISNPSDFETAVSDLVAGGVYVFKWTITGAGTGECAKSEAEVTITVNMPTIPGTTATLEPLVCQNNNTGTITLSGNTGSVLGWQSSPDGLAWTDISGVNTGLTYTFNNLTITTQFRAVVQNPGCTIGYSTPTTVTVAPATTIADAGPNQILCAETSVSLKGNPVKSGETGVWTMVSGDANAIITPGVNSEAIVTKLTPNVTYIFRWTITGNSPCGPTDKDVTIRNNRAIDLNSLTSTAVVCNGQQVVINGSVPIGGEEGVYNYVWEIQVNGAPWAVIPGETGEDLTTTLSTTGTVGFRRTVSSGTCTSVSNAFPIIVQPPIAGNTIRDNQPICSGIRPMPITGDLPTGGDGNFSYQWQSSLNGTTWTDINGVISPDFQPQILTETTYYRRIVSTLECSGALKSISNTVTITVTPNAKAEFTWGSTDTDCYPYTLPIQVVPYADRNNTYTWFANNVRIPSTGANFPGYIIQNSGQSVTIKLVVTSSRGCAPDSLSHTFSTNQAVPASFDQSATEGCGPLPVIFTNTSLLIPGARFEWYSGDILFSTDVHPPTMTLQPDPTGKDSTYVIKLKAITDCGVDSISKNVFVKAKPIAVVTPDKVEVCSPYKITFINTSPGSTNTYYYDFGDGSAIEERTDKLPIDHIYNVTATTEFTFKMIAKNECEVDTMKWTIRVFPQNMTPVLGIRLEEIRGCAPHTVNFENNSIGASRFEFDFGDGNKQTTYTTGIVSHTYTTSGIFPVTMTAFNICSKMTVTKSVEVLAQPVADFEADNTLGCPGLVVKFKNKTVGGLDNKYLWDFGDGTSSAEFEPEHTYSGDQEYYTVKLLATNQLGCPIEVIKTQYIHIVPPPIAAFNVNPSTLISIPNYTFKFEDESTNTPTIWEWDFGDKVGTSQLKNPSYTYLDTGTYKVTLKVMNQQGCFTTTFKNVTIKGVPGYLFVPNSFIPGNTQPELREFRAKGSGIASWRFSVFNKWGQILWETTKLDEGRPAEAWDGTFNGQPMPQGVYYWKIDVQMVNGTEWKGMTYDKSAPKRTGPIHLIR